MKLKTFNQTNCPVNTRVLGLYFSIESRGTIYISTGLYNLLNLEPGSKVEFHQDEENPEDWYITKSTAERAFPVEANPIKFTYRISSAVLVRQLVESINQKDKLKFRIDVKRSPVTIEGKELYMLINSSVK